MSTTDFLHLKIASYNIRHGADVGFDFSVLADDLIKCNIDIAGIQEVDMMTERVNGMNTLECLCRNTPYRYFRFAAAMNYNCGMYGTAVVSKFPIDEFEVFHLTSDIYEPRSVGLARIDFNGKKLNFFNTHIEYKSHGQRKIQLAQLSSLLSACEPFILTGDFNTSDFREFDIIKNSRLANNNLNLFGTFRSTKSAIDNIVISDTLDFEEIGMYETRHSDHNLLWATVTGF